MLLHGNAEWDIFIARPWWYLFIDVMRLGLARKQELLLATSTICSR